MSSSELSVESGIGIRRPVSFLSTNGALLSKRVELSLMFACRAKYNEADCQINALMSWLTHHDQRPDPCNCCLSNISRDVVEWGLLKVLKRTSLLMSGRAEVSPRVPCDARSWWEPTLTCPVERIPTAHSKTLTSASYWTPVPSLKTMGQF